MTLAIILIVLGICGFAYVVGCTLRMGAIAEENARRIEAEMKKGKRDVEDTGP